VTPAPVLAGVGVAAAPADAVDAVTVAPADSGDKPGTASAAARAAVTPVRRNARTARMMLLRRVKA
jgi:hypothetical protein